MNTLEHALVRALNEAADRNAPDDGLVDRLLTSVRDDVVASRRLPVPRRRTTTLLMAAAVAVIVIGGVLIGSRFAAQRPSPITPPVDPAPSPTVVSSSAGSPTSAASSTSKPSSGGNQAPAESFITSRITSTGTPAGFTVGSISFRSATSGVALGTARSDAAGGSAETTRCGVLVTTTDGGLTWSSLSLPEGAEVPGTESCPSWTDNTTTCTTRLNFTDPTAGYLWGPRQIYRTTDGGVSWQELEVGTSDIAQLVSVQGRAFVSAVPQGNLDWGSATLKEVGLGDTALTASTASGGATFGPAELIQGPGIIYRWLNAEAQSPRVQASTSGLSWSDLPKAATRAFTTFAASDGSLVPDVSGSDAIAQVLPVGGKAWLTIPRPSVPSDRSGGNLVYSLAGAVSDQEIAVAVSGFDAIAGGGQAWVTTSDGGRTWNSPVLSTSEAAARGVGYSQVSVGGELIVPWSLGSALLRSADNGRTWTQLDFPRS
ncbi:MAG: sialidase family protein [Nakamurella sp.]